MVCHVQPVSGDWRDKVKAARKEERRAKKAAKAPQSGVVWLLLIVYSADYIILEAGEYQDLQSIQLVLVSATQRNQRTVFTTDVAIHLPGLQALVWI